MPTDKKNHLQRVLDSHKMSKISNLLDKYKDKRLVVKESLENHYKRDIYSPINSGSYAKHTAINTKFDLDIVVPFKRTSFSKIQDMFEDTYDFLCDEFSDTAEVRKQKVSIGVIFFEDDDGDEIDIDVVPGREINEENYPDDKELNIYFNDDKWGFSKGSYTKTNIQAQIDHIRNTGDDRHDIRRIIRLLKIWKRENHPKDYKSFFFELITIKAFKSKDLTGDLWEKLKTVMEYISDSVILEDFALKDPGNSNNNVINTMDSFDRQNLSDRMSNMIERIENNSDNIKTYFPVNDDFDEGDDGDDDKYGLKDPGVVSPSIPKKNQQFG